MVGGRHRQWWGKWLEQMTGDKVWWGTGTIVGGQAEVGASGRKQVPQDAGTTVGSGARGAGSEGEAGIAGSRQARGGGGK